MTTETIGILALFLLGVGASALAVAGWLEADRWKQRYEGLVRDIQLCDPGPPPSHAEDALRYGMYGITASDRLAQRMAEGHVRLPTNDEVAEELRRFSRPQADILPFRRPPYEGMEP